MNDISEDIIYLGVSSCLLGEAVRYDGGHKLDRYITDTLAQDFKLIPFCPEVAIGLGVPRPVIRLEKRNRSIKATIPDDDYRDITNNLSSYGQQTGRAISYLSGYIFKSRSPSCGIEGVKIYKDNSETKETATGIYAKAIIESQPLLPIVEERRLNDLALRENFLRRVVIYHRWQCLETKGITAKALNAFHIEHQSLIKPLHKKDLDELSELITRFNQEPKQTAMLYKEKMMQALTLIKNPY